MIRIAFVLEGTTFQGSANYFRNLFSAMALFPSRSAQPVVFIGNQAPDQLVTTLRDADVIRTTLLDDRSFAGRLRRRVKRWLKGRDPILEAFLRWHRIKVISHVNRSPGVAIRSIGWIPDFQHAYLPAFFSDDERARRDADFNDVIRGCDLVVVSSEAARRDLSTFAPDAVGRSKVLRFVPSIDQTTVVPLDVLQARYAFQAPYFYMPNQFWIHKNHQVVIEALGVLKTRGRAATVLMTGSTKDYRHPQHFDALLARAAELDVAESFKVLGMVPYEDLISLMQHSIAIVNPSLFEGWSSSVEEAKALDKTILLSNLPVHVEQSPIRGVFFDPTDVQELAQKMSAILDEPDPTPRTTSLTLSPVYRESRAQFADTYLRIVTELVGAHP